jgi:hypothetical protein
MQAIAFDYLNGLVKVQITNYKEISKGCHKPISYTIEEITVEHYCDLKGIKRDDTFLRMNLPNYITDK